MAKLEFEDIRFDADPDDGRVRLVFMKVFEMFIDASALEKVGEYSIGEHHVDFPELSEKSASNKFMQLLDHAFLGLRSVLTGRRAVYVHQHSGIPLIGSLYFGLVDRGTNMLEVKPITGCNIDCSFCSVGEGKSSKRLVDFVVETDYLVSETRKLVDYKCAGGCKIDVFINTHGEPLLYAGMIDLVRGLCGISGVGVVSIITNGTLLSEKMVDELVDAGLSQLNISINAFSADKAKELAGIGSYDVERVKSVAKYAAEKIKVVVAPVWMKGVNDSEMPLLVDFAKSIGAEMGIQNYMMHKVGKKVAEQVGWEEFYKQLEVWEKETGVVLKQAGHTLSETRVLDKPFVKGDVVKVEIVCPGRMRDEMLAAAKGRVISVVGCYRTHGRFRVKLIKDKDNVFVGKEV
ncbi:radical SAM protein [Nanoarchaeota archaeon]